VDCDGAYRHPSDHPSRPSVLILKSAKSDHIETGDGSSRFNSAPRLLRVQPHRLDLSGLTLCAVFLVKSQAANSFEIKQKLPFLNPSHFEMYAVDVCSTANTRERDCTKFKENNGDTHEKS